MAQKVATGVFGNSFKQFTSYNNATRTFFRQRGYLPDDCLLHRVPWGHLDSLGHLNNAQYLSIMESSRINYFEMLSQRFKGFPAVFLQPKGISPVFRQANVQWLRQLTRNDVVAVQHRLTKLGSTSINLEAVMVLEQSARLAFKDEIRSEPLTDKDIALSCEETLVLYDFDTKMKTTIPQAWRDILEEQMQLEAKQREVD